MGVPPDAADVDGVADLASVPGAGGGPVLNVVDGRTGNTTTNLLALPGADAYYARCLSLPLFAAMTEDDVARVAAALTAALAR